LVECIKHCRSRLLLAGRRFLPVFRRKGRQALQPFVERLVATDDQELPSERP
jgi:hypothetical protein